MLIKQVIEVFDILDSSTVDGSAVKAYLESVYKAGAEKASYVANKTLRKVHKKVGFVPR